MCSFFSDHMVRGASAAALAPRTALRDIGDRVHPFYQKRFGTEPGTCPVAEAVYERILSLPIFPAMSDGDAEDVIAAVLKVAGAYAA